MENKEKIDEFCNRLTTKGLKPKTIKQYKATLTLFFILIPKNWEKITIDDIEKYIVLLNERGKQRAVIGKTGKGIARQQTNPGQLKPSSISNYFSGIKKFMQHCGKIDVADAMEMPKVQKWIPKLIDLKAIYFPFRSKTKGELEKIVEEAWKKWRINKETGVDKFYIERNSLLFYMLANYGMRIGEASNLQKTSFKFDLKKPIMVLEGKTGQRTNVITDKTVRHVKYHFGQYPLDDYLFTNKHGARLKTEYLETIVKRMLGSMGLEKYHAHDLRHAFVTQLLDDGVPIQEVAKLVGHVSLDTTQRYSDLIKGRVQKAYGPADKVL